MFRAGQSLIGADRGLRMLLMCSTLLRRCAGARQKLLRLLRRRQLYRRDQTPLALILRMAGCTILTRYGRKACVLSKRTPRKRRSEEHTSELQSRGHIV